MPLSVIEAVRVGDPLAVESVLRYYDGYMNKLCTRTFYDLNSLPHVRVDEYMKHRLQATPITSKAHGSHRKQEIAKTKEAVKGRDERSAPLTASSVFAVW